ncbi:enoyl-CoA hydratase-related protein [Rhodococcus sp. X156]|uniref:enoyl-CoA hydratase-related protein n=1 Tax=Rhodococcus sp. X156 TaxID=2499145 RepID=UPI000FDAF68E|nr:enoyl-CoA hydratase-related protein [Rhodococcus sp. X156]
MPVADTQGGLVLAERRGAVAVLTFNRPERLNAWTNAMEDEYFDLLLAAEDDPDVRAVVVTGAGRGFCAGADLAGLRNVGDARPEDLARARPRDLPLTLRKPLVGAINGVAAGLGLVEALYFDVRFASTAARFTAAFSQRGLIAEYGSSVLLPRLVGHSRATDLLLSSRMVDAAEAHSIGLVDHLVDGDVLAAAVDYATTLATTCSPTSMAVMKQQLRADVPYAEALRRSEELMLDAFRGPDVSEGVSSFLQRRPPEFPPLPMRTSHVDV